MKNITSIKVRYKRLLLVVSSLTNIRNKSAIPNHNVLVSNLSKITLFILFLFNLFIISFIVSTSLNNYTIIIKL